MRIAVLILLGITLSNCAVIQAVTGAPIQARDVISSINTVNNLQKYSEPAAREELENKIKQMARSIEAGGETQ
jgi:ABC-type microcin C transport system permease subunit YejB